MPKHNPKLDKPNEKRKREALVEESYEYRRNYTPIFMALVATGVIITIVVLVAFVFSDEAPRVERNDEVRLDYEIYSYEQYENHEDPEIKKTNKWVNCCSRYDDDCDDGLIKGFYNKLRGMKEGDVLNYELIEACKDKDNDGEDDASGDDALSYGDPDDKLYYTDIILYFKVLEINKTSNTDTNESSFIMNTNLNDRGLELFNYILINKQEFLDLF